MDPANVIIWDANHRNEYGTELHQCISCNSQCHDWKVKHVVVENLDDSQQLTEYLGKSDEILNGILALIPASNSESKQIAEYHRVCHSSGISSFVVVLEESQFEGIFNILDPESSEILLAPFNRSETFPRILRFVKRRSCIAFNKPTSIDVPKTKGIIGQSEILHKELSKLETIAQSQLPALITGETGTGKELLCRAIHYLSDRRDFPFVTVNCGAIPQELVENELFGHQSGAYTGAQHAKTGLIHKAEKGTLFLDELDSLPLSAQVKMLRFLQQKEYRELGSSQTHKANVRVIAATNVNIEAEVQEGRIRRDLFYRLNVLRFNLPALKDRWGDVPLLANHFLERYCQEEKRKLRGISQDAMLKLLSHDWPGNVRELENVIARAVVLAKCDLVGVQDIDIPQADERSNRSFKEQKLRCLNQFEKRFLIDTLSACNGNISQAARLAQKNRRAFWQLLQKHKIHVKHGDAQTSENS